MQFISMGDIHALLDFPKVLHAVEEAHRRAPMEVAESILGPQGACYFVRHAVDHGRYMASKLITSFPGNPAKSELPAVQALIALSDGRDWRPLRIIDGTSVTHWRTAADSALGAKYLARTNSETLLIIGAGEMSAWLARAHTSVLPQLKRIGIWNHTTSKARHAAETLAANVLPAQSVEGDLAGLVSQADVICCATRSADPVLRGPGCARAATSIWWAASRPKCARPTTR